MARKKASDNLTIAERLIERPREASYDLWPWLMTIKSECSYFYLYIYLRPNWIIEWNKLDTQSMKYKFDTYELAYEWMIAFLEYVKA